MRPGPGADGSSRPDFPRVTQLGAEVAAYVRDLILSGQVRANQLLPMDKIARDLDISATPVREGLFELHGEGFVQFEPRRGFRVRALTRDDLGDLYWAQAQISGELAARAATRMTSETLTDLRTTQNGIAAAIAAKDPDRVEALNHEFHRAIHRASQSSKLEWLLTILVRYAPRRFYGMIRGWEGHSIDDHEAILRALEKGDAQGGRSAAAAHVVRGGHLVVANMESRGFWDDDDASSSRDHRA